MAEATPYADACRKAGATRAKITPPKPIGKGVSILPHQNPVLDDAVERGWADPRLYGQPVKPAK